MAPAFSKLYSIENYLNMNDNVECFVHLTLKLQMLINNFATILS